MGWNFVAKLIFTLIVSYALRPKPQKQKPATLQDVEAPTAEDGKPICVVLGRRRVRDPNVTWYGDVSSRAIYRRT
jgi:hypothetical protein